MTSTAKKSPRLKGRTEPKRRADQLDELGVEAARLHFEQRLSPVEIRSRVAGGDEAFRSSRDVRVLIDRALRKNLVKVRVDAVPGGVAPVINDDLSRRLASATELRRAVVVEADDLVDREMSGSRSDDRAALNSDKLHLRLAHPAAQILWHSLRPGDRIGVGAGRGVGFTIDALERIVPDKSAFADYQVYSLAGGMMRVPWAYPVENIDADTNAGKLARSLGAKDQDWNNVMPVLLPIFVSRRRDEIIRDHAPHLLDDSEGSGSLDIAVYGCGVLDEHHHLLRVPSPETRPVKAELDDVRGVLKNNSSVAPIIDICDRFWTSTTDPSARSETDDIVDKLNGHVVTVDPSKLGRSRERLVVAGGQQKFNALEGLLLSVPEVRPTTLVTDSWTARRLLEIPM